MPANPPTPEPRATSQARENMPKCTPENMQNASDWLAALPVHDLAMGKVPYVRLPAVARDQLADLIGMMAVANRADAPFPKRPLAQVEGAQQNETDGAAEAALALPAPLEGDWVAVPRVPTEAMVSTGSKMHNELLVLTDNSEDDAKEIWTAMIASAPSAPASDWVASQKLRAALQKSVDWVTESYCEERRLYVEITLDYRDAVAGLTPAPAAEDGWSVPESDRKDILETIDEAAEDWQEQGYTSALAEVRDMANVGRSLIDAIASARYVGSPIEHWSPADDPAEIVTDLLNMLIDATPTTEEAAEGEGK